jgi:hypothetical protein
MGMSDFEGCAGEFLCGNRFMEEISGKPLLDVPARRRFSHPLLWAELAFLHPKVNI